MAKRRYNKKYYSNKVEKIEQGLIKLGKPGEAIVERINKEDIDHPKKKLQRLGRAYIALKRNIEEQIKYKEQPVDIETFCTSPRYLNMSIKEHVDDETGELYPEVLKELKAMCEGDYIEIVCTGSIGSAKTSVAVLLLVYHLYLMSILRDPHKEYSLMKSDEIVMIFQSLKTDQAKNSFERFRGLVDGCAYFKENFMYDKNIMSELRFPNRIIVKPVSGNSTATIGQNCISGLIDEVNFMQITERSKNSRDKGTYDQAMENYTSIVRRRESRFMKMGKTPGVLCLVSSKRYPGEFTDRKIEEAKTNKGIYIYDKRMWDIAPKGKYSGETFKIFVGDVSRKPRILDTNEYIPEADSHLIDEIPVEHLSSFKENIQGALRDVAGRSTLAIEPFILDVERVANCFGSYRSVLSREDCDFENTKIAIYPNRILRKEEPRFVHIDLGLTNDCAGVSCGYVAGFMKIKRGEGEEEIVETMPIICMDFMLQVRPPPNGEIQFAKIRDLLYKLGKQGMTIKWVTLDSWNAIDTIQILRRKGYKTGIQSMDRTTGPYEVTKGAFMDKRVFAPEHDKCQQELISLEKDVKKNKIDHSPNSSKDVSDSLAGVCFGLSTRREIWLKYGIPLTTIPSDLKEKANTAKNSIDGQGQEE